MLVEKSLELDLKEVHDMHGCIARQFAKQGTVTGRSIFKHIFFSVIPKLVLLLVDQYYSPTINALLDTDKIEITTTYMYI